jgi:hypothetical protein
MFHVLSNRTRGLLHLRSWKNAEMAPLKELPCPYIFTNLPMTVRGGVFDNENVSLYPLVQP